MMTYCAVKNIKLFEWKTDRWSLIVYSMLVVGNTCLYEQNVVVKQLNVV